MVKTLYLILGLSLLGLTQCTQDLPPAAGTLSQTDPKAASLMAEAKGYEAQQRWSKAISRYEKVAEKHKMSLEAPQARLSAARLCEQTNEPMDAFDHYQKLITEYPDSPLYAEALKRQQDMAFAAAGGQLTNRVLWAFNVSLDPDTVVKWLKNVRENAPYAESAPKSLMVMGEYLSKRDRISDAIDAYRELADNYPRSPYAPEALLAEAALYRGSIKADTRNDVNYRRAQEAYEEFIQSYSSHPKIGLARKGLAEVKSNNVQKQLDIGDYYLYKMQDASGAEFCYREAWADRAYNPKAAEIAHQRLVSIGAAVTSGSAKSSAATSKPAATGAKSTAKGKKSH